MEEAPPPVHTYEVTIRVGGCDWADVLRRIAELAEHIETHGPECNLASGGAGTAASIDVRHHADVTEETYRAALEAWLETRPRRESMFETGSRLGKAAGV